VHLFGLRSAPEKCTRSALDWRANICRHTGGAGFGPVHKSLEKCTGSALQPNEAGGVHFFGVPIGTQSALLPDWFLKEKEGGEKRFPQKSGFWVGWNRARKFTSTGRGESRWKMEVVEHDVKETFRECYGVEVSDHIGGMISCTPR